jgi:signal transduction histidine kinase
VIALPQWTRSVRFRLTLIYSGVLFGLAALLVASLYVSLRLSLGTDDLGAQGSFVDAGGIALDATALERQVNEHALVSLRNYSFGALGALFVASLAVGWVVAGHVLRPIDEIVTVAREIQATNLARRIALTGPDDELRRLGAAFDEMLARLERSFEAQRRFLADASHELRNPIGIVRANAGLIAAAGTAVPRVRVQARRIDRAGERMAHLVDDLLALARLEAAASPRTPVDVGLVVSEIADELAETKTGVGVECGAAVAGTIEADEQALRRAFANLVENAVRHTDPGGRVRVGAGRREGWAWMAAADEGPGVPWRERERIFDRFHRADPGRSRADGGSGLGLAIAREIARAHGGDVRLHSPAEGGATFVVWLPTGAGASSPPADCPF